MADSKWIPLEASPDVFNAWSTPLGLPPTLTYLDLYSLDPDFLSFHPQPVHAVLLLFPSRGKLAAARKDEEGRGEGVWRGKLAGQAGAGEGEGVWWIKQLIGNACGSIGLLHSLLNLPPSLLTPSTPLSKFLTQSLPLSPRSRAKLLDETDFFEKAHKAGAVTGQSKVPESREEIDTDYHFISFVRGVGEDGKDHIVELDGGREGPFDRGQTTQETFLSDVAKVVQEKYMDRSDGEHGFNIITLGAKGEGQE